MSGPGLTPCTRLSLLQDFVARARHPVITVSAIAFGCHSRNRRAHHFTTGDTGAACARVSCVGVWQCCASELGRRAHRRSCAPHPPVFRLGTCYSM
jgi:hypothetical protein